MIKSTVLTEFQLCTIFTEIEAITNNHLLTHVNNSQDDFEALTLNSFLLERLNAVSEVCQDADGDESSRRKWN